MTTIVSSTALSVAVRDLSTDIQNGDYNLDGAFFENLSVFFDQALGGAVEPELIQLSSSRVELRFAMLAADYRLVLTGSGIGPVSSLAALDQALQNGLATGAINAMTVTLNGTTQLNMALAATGYTLTSGVDRIVVTGSTPTSFEQLTELAGLLSQLDVETIALMSPAERSAYFSDLSAFGITGLHAETSGSALFDLTLTSGSLVLQIGELRMTFLGVLPDDFGALASLAYDISRTFPNGEPIDLSLLSGLGVDSLVITGSGGAELLRLTGPVTTGHVERHTVNGTAGDDVAVLDDIPFNDADEVQINLLGGNDQIVVDTYDIAQRAFMGVAIPDQPEVRISGGAGLNLLVLQNNAWWAPVSFDMQDGEIEGFSTSTPSIPRYRLYATEFQRVVLEGQNHSVLGSSGNNMVSLGTDFWGGRLFFDGRGGDDILDLTGVFQSQTDRTPPFFTGMSQSDLAGYYFSVAGSSGAVVMQLQGVRPSPGAPNATLVDVEYLRVLRDGSTTDVEFVPLSSLVDLSHSLSAGAGAFRGSYLNDTVSGSEAGDEIYGNNGNDLLAGNGGNDSLYGDDGNDTLNGGTGDDFLFGGATDADLRDLMFGGDGNDSMDGGAGNDEMHGGSGNDTVIGGLGSDTLIGNDGDDVIVGSGGSDAIFGNAGRDFINGGFGFDRLNGGADADSFFHQGVAGHGSDWIQDYNAAEGDRLVVGISGATRSQFQVNFANTAGAGNAGVQEAFVIYRPTGQILFALVDGGGQSSINLQIGGQVFDLLA